MPLKQLHNRKGIMTDDLVDQNIYVVSLFPPSLDAYGKPNQ